MLIAQNETESKIPYIEIQSIIYNMTHSGPVYFTSYACLCLDLYLFGIFFFLDYGLALVFHVV